VDCSHDVGPRQTEEVVVASNVARVVSETLAPEIGLGKTVSLDECAGCAIKYENPLPQQRTEQKQALLARPDGACRRLI
jgi:hypothetical protein